MLSLLKKIFFINVNESVSMSNKKSFEEVINEWLKFHHTEIAESTYYGYKMMCPLLRKYFADYMVSCIDTFVINNFILEKKREGLSNAAIYNYCRILGKRQIFLRIS